MASGGVYSVRFTCCATFLWFSELSLDSWRGFRDAAENTWRGFRMGRLKKNSTKKKTPGDYLSTALGER